jgi:hypothetical protein
MFKNHVIDMVIIPFIYSEFCKFLSRMLKVSGYISDIIIFFCHSMEEDHINCPSYMVDFIN